MKVSSTPTPIAYQVPVSGENELKGVANFAHQLGLSVFVSGENELKEAYREAISFIYTEVSGENELKVSRAAPKAATALSRIRRE